MNAIQGWNHIEAIRSQFVDEPKKSDNLAAKAIIWQGLTTYQRRKFRQQAESTGADHLDLAQAWKVEQTAQMAAKQQEEKQAHDNEVHNCSVCNTQVAHDPAGRDGVQMAYQNSAHYFCKTCAYS